MPCCGVAPAPGPDVETGGLDIAVFAAESYGAFGVGDEVGGKEEGLGLGDGGVDPCGFGGMDSLCGGHTGREARLEDFLHIDGSSIRRGKKLIEVKMRYVLWSYSHNRTSDDIEKLRNYQCYHIRTRCLQRELSNHTRMITLRIF